MLLCGRLDFFRPLGSLNSMSYIYVLLICSKLLIKFTDIYCKILFFIFLEKQMEK